MQKEFFGFRLGTEFRFDFRVELGNVLVQGGESCLRAKWLEFLFDGFLRFEV